MNRRPRRVIALVLAASVTIIGCGSGGDSATQTSVATQSETAPTISTSAQEPAATAVSVRVRAGRVAGDLAPTVPAGERVSLTVTSDIADTVHVHGYDHEFAVGPGTAGTFRFVAHIPGRFEVEMHDSELKLMMLTVK